MKGKGLTLEGIVEAASALVVEKGYNNFSMRELAQQLHCQAASLYNHLTSIDDINREIGRLAADKMNAALAGAVEGKERDQALEAVAHAYRHFVKNNYELYQAILGLPALDQDKSLTIGRESLNVIRDVVNQYHISKNDAVHFSRCMRGTLHGFVSFEMAGYYSGKVVELEDSFCFMVKGYTEWINGMERGNGD